MFGAFISGILAGLSSRANGRRLKRMRASDISNAAAFSTVVMNITLMRKALEKIQPGCTDGWTEVPSEPKGRRHDDS